MKMSRVPKLKYDQGFEKLENLVHYIAYKCNTEPTKLGATKLNKILWFSDAQSFLLTGKSITGATYIKRQFGPVPQDMVKARESLVEKGAVVIAEGFHFGREQTQIIVLKRPDLSAFTADDISLVDEVLEYICDNHTATTISDLTHDVIWNAAQIGEELPVYAYLASKIGSITKEDIDWATTEAKRHNLVN